jgi:ribonuclease R
MVTVLTGRISVHPRGFGFVTCPDGTSAFVSPPDLNRFLADDRVQFERTGGDRPSATALTLLERPRDRLCGSVVVRGGQRFLRVDRVVANTDWPLVDADDVAEGAWVVGAIDATRVRATEVLTGARADTERVLCRHNLAGDASGELDAAVAALPPFDARTEAKRRDLRAQVCVTIDGPSTKDIDDALLAFAPDDDGGLRVVIAIADVSAAVAEGSPFDRDARQRGTSVYLPGRVVPMLPRALSEDRLSLLEGVERCALTAELRIDPEGRVLAVDVHEALIRSSARLTYDAVARFLDDGESDAVPAHTHDTLRLLRRNHRTNSLRRQKKQPRPRPRGTVDGRCK